MSFFPISECCTKGSVLPGTPAGVMQPAGTDGIQVDRYYARPAELRHPKVCLVLLYDIFGFSVVSAGRTVDPLGTFDTQPNPKLLADTYANRLGVEVYVPDYIPNPPPATMLDPAIEYYPGEKAEWSWLSWGLGKLSMLKLIPYLPGVLWSTPEVDKAVADLASKYDTIGAVGYCRGGTMVSHLLAREDCPITAGVLFHPEWKPQDYPEFKKPSRFLLAEKDQYITSREVDDLKQVFADGHAPFSVEVFEGTTHGFAARPAFEYEPTMKAFHAANESAAAFLTEELGL